MRHLYRAGYRETPTEDFSLELRYRAGEFAVRTDN